MSGLLAVISMAVVLKMKNAASVSKRLSEKFGKLWLAAIGSVPLTAGLACGKIILSVAVMGIVLTAPLGALGMDMSY